MIIETKTSNILFSEKQKFNQLWVWVMILISGIISILYVTNKEPIETTTLIVVLCSFVLVILIFAVIKLETVVKNDGIYVRFFPLHVKFKRYEWKDIDRLYIREYSPISEYGGWGIRIGFSGKGNAFNISGNKGLQLELKNNKKLLIGTNRSSELSDTLEQIGKL